MGEEREEVAEYNDVYFSSFSYKYMPEATRVGARLNCTVHSLDALIVDVKIQGRLASGRLLVNVNLTKHETQEECFISLAFGSCQENTPR